MVFHYQSRLSYDGFIFARKKSRAEVGSLERGGHGVGGLSNTPGGVGAHTMINSIMISEKIFL